MQGQINEFEKQMQLSQQEIEDLNQQLVANEPTETPVVPLYEEKSLKDLV